LTEGDLEVEIPAGALEQDSSLEIARVTINGQNASNRDGEITAYEISTGGKDDEIELKEPARVIFHNADSNQRPVLYSGASWLPIDDYEYDSNSKELSFEINFIEDDTNEYIQSGGEEGDVESPVVIATLNKDIDYDSNLISGKGRFKVFYNKSDDKAYAESIANTIEDAYDYYKDLGYKAPVKTLVNNRKSTSNYIYAYIYKNTGSKYDTCVGVAWTYGYMGFNREMLDMNKPRYKSTCYHELLHLIQSNYAGNRRLYKTWFGESMCTAMQYYAINRPVEKYDVASEARWNSNILWDEIFNQTASKDVQEYNKYIIWSYLLKQSDAKLFHNIMSELARADIENPELLNSAFQKKFTKSLPTLMNEIIEDYYIKGAFFNKNYFYKLGNRDPNQPYGEIVEGDSVTPAAWSNDYSIKPLSMRYFCYSSKNFQGKFEVDFSKVSSNCKIKIYPMKNNNGTYEVSTVQEVTGNATKTYTLDDETTNVFILIENISMTLNATVSVQVSKQ
jgi:hypothetical protein